MRAIALLGLTLPLLAGGCSLYPDSSETEGDAREVVAAREKDRQFQDIPVPKNFSYREESFGFQHGKFRCCNLLYSGSLDVGSTTEFMSRQMKQAGWELVERSLENGRNIMIFGKDTSYAKNGERCTVTIQRRPSERRTLLTVTIKPSDNDPIPAPAPRAEP